MPSSVSGATIGRLVSLNVGLPRDVAWEGRTVHTAIWKSGVDGARMVRRLNVDGDGQGDLKGHGGENRAVFVYQMSSYHYWSEQLHRDDFVMGQFGENFTVDGLSDDDVCIGDRYRIGDALFEVTQPRVTCFRIGMRMNEPQMPALLVRHGKPGFYFRVVSEGEVKAGDPIALVARDDRGMSVAAINSLLYLPPHPMSEIERATHITALSPGWRSSFQALLQKPAGQKGNPGLAPPSQASTAWSGIVKLTRDSDDVVILDLESADGAELAKPLPGQFVVVNLKAGSAAPSAMRSYSLCGSPNSNRYRLGIRRVTGGAVSTYLGEHAAAGDTIGVSAPRGAFVLEPGEDPVALISAGIGATPVLAMLYSLVEQKSQRAVWWLHGARNHATHPFAEEARALVASLARSRAHIRYSRPNSSDRVGRDFDSTGHIDPRLIESLALPRDTKFYLCGPPAFLNDLRLGLTQIGFAVAQIYTEVFGSTPVAASGIVAATTAPAPHQPAEASVTGPSVSFSRSNVTVRWNERYQSILELAEACDVPVRWSCRTGVCHICESGLISGDVSYKPEPLEVPARGDLLICCARPRDDLILDL
jgi:MOSC domain-containing protein YiiM/ferredoxin-NADP reductase